MNYHRTGTPLELIAPNTLISIKNYYNVIVERSNLAFYDLNLNNISQDNTKTPISDLHQFALLAEGLLKDASNDFSYTIVVFDIDNFSKINKLYGYNTGNNLLTHIECTIKANIGEPNLYCRMHDDNFALLLVNYKEIDIALLVIQLTEEINHFNRLLQIKLSFGICKVDEADCDIPYLCTRAFYAKSTIKGKAQHLLANFDDVILSTQAI